MESVGLAALIISVCAGMAQVIVATATLVRALRVEAKVEAVGRELNGRLDLLLAEREARLRAEHAADLERLRLASVLGLSQSPRPEGLLVPRPAGERPGEEGV